MGIAQCRKTSYLCTRKQKTTKKIIQELNFRRVVQVRAEGPKFIGAVRHERAEALILYGVQLFVNIGWSVIFFKFKALWLAFIWLMLLWVLIIFTIWRFFHVNRAAAWLMVPYLLWVTFAAYLNVTIAIIN